MTEPLPLRSALLEFVEELGSRMPLTADERALIGALRGARPGRVLTDEDRRWVEDYLADRGLPVPDGLFVRIEEHLSDLAVARDAFYVAGRRRENAIAAVLAAEADLTDATENLLALGQRPLPAGRPLFATFHQIDQDQR